MFLVLDRSYAPQLFILYSFTKQLVSADEAMSFDLYKLIFMMNMIICSSIDSDTLVSLVDNEGIPYLKRAVFESGLHLSVY